MNTYYKIVLKLTKVNNKSGMNYHTDVVVILPSVDNYPLVALAGSHAAGPRVQHDTYQLWVLAGMVLQMGRTAVHRWRFPPHPAVADSTPLPPSPPALPAVHPAHQHKESVNRHGNHMKSLNIPRRWRGRERVAAVGCGGRGNRERVFLWW